jgi:hypothetical protein
MAGGPASGVAPRESLHNAERPPSANAGPSQFSRSAGRFLRLRLFKHADGMVVEVVAKMWGMPSKLRRWSRTTPAASDTSPGRASMYADTVCGYEIGR